MEMLCLGLWEGGGTSLQELWLEAHGQRCRACQTHSLAALHSREGGGRKSFVCARLNEVARERSSMPQCLFCSLANTGRSPHTGVPGILPSLGRLRYVCTKAKPRISRTSLVLGSARAHVAMEAGCRCQQSESDPEPGSPLCPTPEHVLCSSEHAAFTAGSCIQHKDGLYYCNVQACEHMCTRSDPLRI